MRCYDLGMRLVVCLSILWASSAWAADEAVDRAASEKVVSTLNNSPGSPGLFTDDFADGAALTSLGVYRDNPRAAIHVCVSHAPWGELGPCPAAKMSRFVIQSIRLITPDVALVDAVNDRRDVGESLHSPVLLVLRKEGGAWKIASLRVLARLEPSLAQ